MTAHRLSTLLKTAFELTIAAIFLIGYTANAAVFVASTSGSWSSAVTWGGLAPGDDISNHQVVISPGVTVSMDSDITLNGPAGSIQIYGSLDGGSSYDLIVSNGTVLGSGQIHVGEFDLSGSGNLAFTGSIESSSLITSNSSFSLESDVVIEDQLVVNGSVLSSAGGNVTLESGSTIIINDGELQLSGNLSANGEYNVVYEGPSTTAGAELETSALASVLIDLDSPLYTLTINNDATIDGDVAIHTGILNIEGQSVTIVGNLSASASGSVATDSDTELSVYGSSSGAVEFASEEIGSLTIGVGSGSFELGSNLSVYNDLELESGQFVLNGNELIIAGTISSSAGAEIDADESASISIESQEAQIGTIHFSASGNLGSLSMNSSLGSEVNIASDIEVTDELSFTSGLVISDGAVISVGSDASVEGGSETSHLVTLNGGSMQAEVEAGGNGTLYVVGNGESYNPITLVQAQGAATGDFSVSTVAEVLANGEAGINMADFGAMVDNTWHVESELSADIDLTMYVEWPAQAQTSGFTSSDCYLSHYTNASWDLAASVEAQVNAEGRFEIHRSGITSLSPFAVFDSNTTVGIEEASNESLLIYPNPVGMGKLITIETEEPKMIEILAADGKVVSSHQLVANITAINIGDLSSGFYTVRTLSDESISTSRLIIQ